MIPPMKPPGIMRLCVSEIRVITHFRTHSYQCKHSTCSMCFKLLFKHLSVLKKDSICFTLEPQLLLSVMGVQIPSLREKAFMQFKSSWG